MVQAKENGTEPSRPAVDITEAADRPRRGDHHRCQSRGMEFELITDCGRSDPNHVYFECRGREMTRV